MYYLCSGNKGADQVRGYREADLRLCFRICKKQFSQDEVQMISLYLIAMKDMLRCRPLLMKCCRYFSDSFQIISYLVKHCIDSEGLLRVPGLVTRIKVCYNF